MKKYLHRFAKIEAELRKKFPLQVGGILQLFSSRYGLLFDSHGIEVSPEDLSAETRVAVFPQRLDSDTWARIAGDFKTEVIADRKRRDTENSIFRLQRSS